MAGTHQGHRERIRAKIEREGIEHFYPHELLEYLLYYAAARGDMNPVAHELIDDFGSIDSVLHAPAEELVRVRGVGPSVARWIRAVGEMRDAYADLRVTDRPTVGNYAQVREFAERNMADIAGEEVWHLCMGKSGRLLLSSRIVDNSAWGEPNVLRTALQEVLAVNAHSVVILQLAGGREPKAERYDRLHTLAYAQTLRSVGVYLLDHVIFGAKGIYSMVRAGDLEGIARPGDGADLLMERYLME